MDEATKLLFDLDGFRAVSVIDVGEGGRAPTRTSIRHACATLGAPVLLYGMRGLSRARLGKTGLSSAVTREPNQPANLDLSRAWSGTAA
jgi:hypothetical protein